MRAGVLALTLTFALSPLAASAQVEAGGSGPDAEGRYQVRCIVDLASGGQIAVVNAASESACGSAGPRCAGDRAWSAVRWSDTPTYTKPGSAEVCELAQ